MEDDHWWHRGMRSLSAVLLSDRLGRRDQALVDAGCGTGGFLRWALDLPAFASGAGVDVSPYAIEVAREHVPQAALRVASVTELPYADRSFDVAVCNDVLQHLAVDEVAPALAELARVLRPGGALLVRTRGHGSAPADPHSWDRARLRADLSAAGLTPLRITFANAVGSAFAELRGRGPRSVGAGQDGIPRPVSRAKTAVGSVLLNGEARLLRSTRLSIPYGHTVMARADRP